MCELACLLLRLCHDVVLFKSHTHTHSPTHTSHVSRLCAARPPSHCLQATSLQANEITIRFENGAAVLSLGGSSHSAAVAPKSAATKVGARPGVPALCCQPLLLLPGSDHTNPPRQLLALRRLLNAEPCHHTPKPTHLPTLARALNPPPTTTPTPPHPTPPHPTPPHPAG